MANTPEHSQTDGELANAALDAEAAGRTGDKITDTAAGLVGLLFPDQN